MGATFNKQNQVQGGPAMPGAFADTPTTMVPKQSIAGPFGQIATPGVSDLIRAQQSALAGGPQSASIADLIRLAGLAGR